MNLLIVEESLQNINTLTLAVHDLLNQITLQISQIELPNVQIQLLGASATEIEDLATKSFQSLEETVGMVSMSMKTGLKNTILSVQSISSHIEALSTDIERLAASCDQQSSALEISARNITEEAKSLLRDPEIKNNSGKDVPAHTKQSNGNNDFINDKYKELYKLHELIINITPTGLVILTKDGIIKYVNQSIGRILGSTETVGLNILEFDTIKQSNIYNGIINASRGIYNEVLGEKYISFTSRIKKVLNIYIAPVIDENTANVSDIILFIHDITKENDLKVEIGKTYISTIEAFAELIDARDKYTGEHSKNVSKYVSMICEELDLDEIIKGQIRVAANIHDLGKIGISDSLLNKPGKLTKEEYESVKKHADIGAEIVSKIVGFDNISLIIRHHHEKWNGTGYSSGLKGSEIPLGSQIIAIADTYDAVTTDRVYRRKLGKETAIKILLSEKGKQFNPRAEA